MGVESVTSFSEPARGMHENIAAAVQRAEGILITHDFARVAVHYFGRLAQELARQNGCAPDALVSMQRALAEACTAGGDDSRHASVEPIVAQEILELDHDFVDTQTAAQMLGIKPDTVRFNYRAGALKGRKVGRQLMIAKSSIENLKNARRSA
jgi:hypothetical protein